MADYGVSDTSTTSLGVNQFPISEVYVPNVGLIALEGGAQSTDGTNKKSAPVNVSIKDGSDATSGLTTDAAVTGDTAGTKSAKLRGLNKILADIWDSVNHRIKVDGSSVTQPVSGTFWQAMQPIQQADLTATGTISAAQPVIGTPVANATVQLALGQGQSSWMAQLTAGAGFTSATTIVVDQTIDGGTTWFVTNFKVAGSLTNTPVQSIVGPGPLLLSGDAASKGILRIRCSVLNASETINVTLRSGAGVGSVGLLSSIPAGSNNIGSVNVANANANGQATKNTSSPVVLPSDQIVPVQGSFTELVGNGTGVVNADNTLLISSTDVSAYKWLSLQITGTYSATLNFQISNDNINWVSTQLSLTSAITNQNISPSATGTNQIWVGPVLAHYFRVLAHPFASNTSLAAVLELYTAIPALFFSAQQTNAAATTNIVGTSDFHLISAATTNATNIKNSGGQVYGYEIYNTNAAVRYVKLYNKASTPAPATDPVFRTIAVPPNGRAFFHSSTGLALGTGISVATVTGASDTDNTSVGAGDLVIDIDWK